MNESNVELRERLTEIENIVLQTLHNQPDDKDKCYAHLMSAIEKIREITSIT